MATKTLLLDVDGTIWDSYPWYASLLAGLSGGEEAQFLERLHNGESVVRLHNSRGISRANFVRYGLENLHDLQLFDRVPETLGELIGRGCRLGIVTSLPDSIVSPFLREKDLLAFFETVVAAKFVIPPKPNPHGILTALSKLGVDSDQDVFYAGDTASDSEAATRAGISFAWASFGYGKIEDPSSFDVLEKFEDLLKL